VKAPEGEPQAKPKRMTQGEILAAFVERMQAQHGGEHSSVRLTRNARGDTQIEVAVRTGESDELATVDDAAAKAKAVYDLLRSLYPMSSPEKSNGPHDG